MTEMKKCTKCGEEKPKTKEFFNSHRGRMDGFDSKCRICNALHCRRWTKKNPVKKKEGDRRHYQANKTAILQTIGRYKQKNKRKLADYYRDYHFRESGWTLESRLAAFAAQGGKCAVCQTPCLESSVDRTCRGDIRCDHCHKTGLPRALLCDDCNVALGRVDDDPARLIALAIYAAGWKAIHGSSLGRSRAGTP